jgi:Ca-activated chloride channel family protein
MRQILLYSAAFLVFIFSGQQAFSQSGSLRGKVIDAATQEPIPFASIIVKIDSNKVINGGTSDFDGNYFIKSIKAGKYDVEVLFIGYSRQLIKGVIITAGKTLYLNYQLESSTQELQAVTITAYKQPLISYDQCSSSATIIRTEISKMPGRSANSMAVSVGGVFSNRNGRMGGVRGSRSTVSTTYIDGVRVINSNDSQTHVEINNESYDEIVENEFENVLYEPLSTFAVDVDKASYSNIRRYLNNDQLPPSDAVRIEEMINYFHYDYPSPTNNQPFSINLEAAECPWNSEHQLVQIALKAKDVNMEDELPISNLVFLIDVSGSMSAGNKLPLLKKSFNIFIDKLRAEDRIAIVVYSSTVRCVLESTSGAEKTKIKNAMSMLRAEGSTAGGEGIQLAYKIANENFIDGGNNRVIMATDGDFNVGISDNTQLKKMIEKKRDDGIFLTILGYGMGNYKDNRMEMLSNAGNGNYAYIDNILEAEKVLGTEMYGTLFTIAKDVKIQIEFNPNQVKAYRLIGYENRMLAANDFNDDKKDAGEIGLGHYVIALYEIIPADSKEKISELDSLKYQSRTIIESNELLTVKFRYKEPDGNKSKLITKSITVNDIEKENISDNLLLSSSVAEFGLLLRKSKYRGNATYGAIIKRARKTLKNDDEGYRAEFIKMVKTARILES